MSSRRKRNDGELPTAQGRGPDKGKSKSRSNVKKSKPSAIVQEKGIKIEGVSYKRLVPGSMGFGTGLADQCAGYSSDLTEQPDWLCASDIDIRACDQELGNVGRH